MCVGTCNFVHDASSTSTAWNFGSVLFHLIGKMESAIRHAIARNSHRSFDHDSRRPSYPYYPLKPYLTPLNHTLTTMCRFVIYKGTSPVQLSHVSVFDTSFAGRYWQLEHLTIWIASDTAMSFNHQPGLRLSSTTWSQETNEWGWIWRRCVGAGQS